MTWYYATGGQQVGPITDADLERLVNAGMVTAETLIWHEGLSEWQPYSRVKPGAVASAAFAGGTSAALDLRPMGIGDILDRTFRLYRSHFMPFFLLMLLIQAVAFVCTLAWQTALWSNLQTGPRPGEAPAFAALGSLALFFPVMIIIIVFTQIGIGTLTAAVSAAFLQQEVSLRQAYLVVRNRLGRLLGATVLSSLIIGLGFMLCVIPGIYFSLWYLLVGEVVILENVGVTDSLRRSKELMRIKTDRGFAQHNYTKAGIILLITFALGAVVGGIVSVPFGILNAMSGAHHAGSPFGPLQLLQGVLTMTVQAAVAPVGRIAMILFYYDIRIRKEGFDLEILASALGRQPTPVTGTT
ncbi:MAG TPA: GYF domain-containing protein [Verrucomicrobiae bacterium]|nr:GYF domain-containing protein [Verrucomicrobiae bacterium]